MAVPSESGGDMLMPALVSGEGGEVGGLELADGGGWEMGGLGHCDRLTVIVSAVSKSLREIPVRVTPVVGSFSNCAISRKITCPRESGPCKSANCSVKVA